MHSGIRGGYIKGLVAHFSAAFALVTKQMNRQKNIKGAVTKSVKLVHTVGSATLHKMSLAVVRQDNHRPISIEFAGSRLINAHVDGRINKMMRPSLKIFRNSVTRIGAETMFGLQRQRQM